MTAPEPEPFSYPLKRVAELTGTTYGFLDQACRDGKIRYAWLGKQRVMTPEWIRQMLADNAAGAEPEPKDEVAEARERAENKRREAIRNREARRQRRAAA